ncbi:P-loop containing nucleoside triphosphate hydrolase protein [Trichoderma sp. SZMC 28012]
MTINTDITMHSQRVPYIPAGCVGISQQDCHISEEDWLSEENRTWRSFMRYHDTLNNGGHAIPSDTPYINPNLQESLFQSSKLSPLGKLFQARWCKLEFCVSTLGQQLGIVRVYLLPDDVLRRSVDRSDSSLEKARLFVLRSLDYSPCAWKAIKEPDHSGRPVLEDPSSIDNEKDVSLLELFNTIPSPCPDLNAVDEPYTQDAMYNLMESQVPGLKTTLYSHQRRSAALMLQKETQPGQILDPRLLHLRDTNGSHWYMDPVTGVVLLEPRYYDGVSGGILAEQMGAGKTAICLALMLATKHLPTSPPDFYKAGEPPVRRRIASLADMAASCATRHAVPWKSHFEAWKEQHGYEFSHCNDALSRNRGYYFLPAPEPRRGGRSNRSPCHVPPKKIYLSSASVVIVPNNLVAQWKQEINKHTEGLKVLILGKNDETPSLEDILTYDVLLFSQTRFEMIHKQFAGVEGSVFASIHFKRCIVDEGHKLGNSKMSNRSNLLIGLDSMHFSSRWIVTGTPSHGLYGVENPQAAATHPHTPSTQSPTPDNKTNQTKKSSTDEKSDLERIGSIAALYLKARPWANTVIESGDTLADWTTYLMLPKHSSKSQGRWNCLESTLNSLIIRHRISEIGALLPSVNEKIIVLDGSYQDQLSLNLFSMMIVFNSVQSQREDMDYFFHQKQRKALLQIVQNLKQASFFGGSFFTVDEIAKSVETAEKFLVERKVPISSEDESLLQEAIQFGNLAMSNKLRNLTNQFHEMAVSVTGFPGNAGESWSLDGASAENGICTSTSMLLSLQKLIYNAAGSEEKLNSLLNGELISEGALERIKLLNAAAPEKDSKSKDKSSETLAGNTKLGDDSPKKARSHGVNGIEPRTLAAESFVGPLEQTKITATVSAKLSYLIDNLVKYQEEEKIIVFYENENVAWYLASMLDVLQIQHLIYAKSLKAERRAQYVNTFNHNDKFRVLLMDISQAAFGLDMREASRIYFINPVLNPQVEAQAIGRARRISQKKPVWVETLVLKNSLDEVILERKGQMTQADHRHVKSILDVRPIFNWIKNTKISPMGSSSDSYTSQMATLHTAQAVFGRGFGVTSHPDEDIILDENRTPDKRLPVQRLPVLQKKRPYEVGPGSEGMKTDENAAVSKREVISQPARRVRFAAD